MTGDMITYHVTQGTQEWLDLRTKFHTASEANSMMGCSSYMSRTQLLDQKKSGIVAESTSYEKKLFAIGHKTEDMARPLVQDLIDDDLFQLVASKDDLLASFDGITLMGDIGFEHKIWNEKLAESVRNGQVPESHVWQLEQQLYVSGAEKIIFVVSDGTSEKFAYCWYESNPVKRKQLLAGWEKFNLDLKTHIVGEQKLEGNSPEELMQLSIHVTGSVTDSNLDIFELNALETIDNINTELESDQDFADAEKDVKWCKSAETAITNAKESILAQTADISAILTVLDNMSDKARSKRLTLEKLVKSQKENIKKLAITEGINEILEHIQAQKYQVNIAYCLDTAIKNKKTLSSIKESIFLEVTRTKAAIDIAIDKIENGINYINDNSEGYEFLFSDKQQLAESYSDEFLADEVQKRIESYKQEIAKNLEAESQLNKSKAEAEAARLIEQAKRQKSKKAEHPSPTVISASAFNDMLYFDHNILAEHLGYEPLDEYSYNHAATMIQSMIKHLTGLHAEISKEA